jgi:N-acylglucosamine 2-epimerase
MDSECRNELLESVVPFWLRHSLDLQYGGYLHHLDRDGTVFCTDKMMWLQHREVWMFSRLYNRLEKRPEWLNAARLGAEFLRSHGRDDNGDWYFLLDRQGQPLVAPYSIFSDLFAVIAYLEYGRATGEGWAFDIARETFRRVEKRLDNPKGRYEKRLPAARTTVEHALPMIMFSVTRELSAVFGDKSFEMASRRSLDFILDTLVEAETGILYEFAMPDGSRPQGPAGRLVNPGHAIESAWFMLEYARETEDDKLTATAVSILNSAFDAGWDRDNGGLFSFVDIGGRPPLQLEWSMKLWWPHTEALYAFLLAHRLTGDAGLLERHRMVFDYCWKHFRDPDYGEWFGYLDRDGHPTHLLKGGRFKGFFHLPRALLNCALL